MTTLVAALVLVLVIGVVITPVPAQFLSGCPMLGCFPSGTFALNVSVPSQKDQVKVLWTTELTNTSLPSSIRLGCVTNENNIVCPTPTGYVSVVSDTGEVEWRTEPLLRNPPLPLLDVYGDFIACDGHFLCKVNNDGSFVKPNIKFQNTSPVFSLNIAQNNLFLIVSEQGGLFCYNTAGIIFASIFLQGTVERLNGTFIPVSPPVFSGNRAYILTEFKVDDGVEIPPGKVHPPRQTRLFALDLGGSMVDRMRVAWHLVLRHSSLSSPEDSPVDTPGRQPSDPFALPSTLLFSAGVVYVSSPPAPRKPDCPLGGCVPTPALGHLWAVEDRGREARQLFRVDVASSDLSLFDTTVSTPPGLAWTPGQPRQAGHPEMSVPQSKTAPLQEGDPCQEGLQLRVTVTMSTRLPGLPPSSTDSHSLLWVSPRGSNGTIFGIAPRSGEIIQNFSLAPLLGVSMATVTSKVMSVTSDTAYSLVLGARLENDTVSSEERGRSEWKQWSALVAVQVLPSGGKTPQLLWAVPLTSEGEVVGQVSASWTTGETSQRALLLAVTNSEKTGARLHAVG